MNREKPLFDAHFFTMALINLSFVGDFRQQKTRTNAMFVEDFRQQ